MIIRQIKLYSADIPALKEFYGSLIGLDCTLGEKTLTIQAGKSVLQFIEAASEESPYYHFAFNIPSNKAAEALVWLKEKAPVIWLEEFNSYIADFVNWNAKSIYFHDPAGNIVELIARRDLHDNPTTPFSAALVRNISEIGIVFPDQNFEAEINRLLAKYSFSYFPKQKPFPFFKVIGDDEGLLICVPQNRDWYPLKQKPARIFPMEVRILVENRETTLNF